MTTELYEYEGLVNSDMLITEEETDMVLELLDELDLADRESDFILDLAGQGDDAMLTYRQRSWLASIYEKYS